MIYFLDRFAGTLPFQQELILNKRIFDLMLTKLGYKNVEELVKSEQQYEALQFIVNNQMSNLKKRIMSPDASVQEVLTNGGQICIKYTSTLVNDVRVFAQWINKIHSVLFDTEDVSIEAKVYCALCEAIVAYHCDTPIRSIFVKDGNCAIALPMNKIASINDWRIKYVILCGGSVGTKLFFDGPKFDVVAVGTKQKRAASKRVRQDYGYLTKRKSTSANKTLNAFFFRINVYRYATETAKGILLMYQNELNTLLDFTFKNGYKLAIEDFYRIMEEGVLEND